MLIDFDPAKDELNRAQHGLSLAFAKQLIWEEAFVWVDDRYEYDEIRMIGLIPEGDALYYVSFVDHDEVWNSPGSPDTTLSPHESFRIPSG